MGFFKQHQRESSGWYVFGMSHLRVYRNDPGPKILARKIGANGRTVEWRKWYLDFDALSKLEELGVLKPAEVELVEE